MAPDWFFSRYFQWFQWFCNDLGWLFTLFWSKLSYTFSIRRIFRGNFLVSYLCKNQAILCKFGRSAANPQVQLLPGRIMTLNENPSLSRSREAHRKRTRELGPLGKWRRATGRMDERTGGWTDGRWGSLRSLRNGRTDGWADGGARSARFGMDGLLGISWNFLEFLEIS